MTVTKQIIFIGLFYLLVIACTGTVYAESEWQQGKYVPPPVLPPLNSNSDPAQLVERLKQYIITGEKMADQFEELLIGYRDLANQYVSVTKGCLNANVFTTPLFRDADQYSICNKTRQEELKRHLKMQASKLDRLEDELKVIRRKVVKSSELVVEMAKFQELQQSIKKMDKNIIRSEDIERELRKLENQ